jgi:hypothetical protein
MFSLVCRNKPLKAYRDVQVHRQEEGRTQNEKEVSQGKTDVGHDTQHREENVEQQLRFFSANEATGSV